MSASSRGGDVSAAGCGVLAQDECEIKHPPYAGENDDFGFDDSGNAERRKLLNEQAGRVLCRSIR